MTNKDRSPWFYIPTMYFAEGLPYILINIASVAMYKKMGVSNQLIGLTSILYLPWVLKMFWSPMVDVVSTKRWWIILTQIVMFITFGLVAFSLSTPFFFWLSVFLFGITAFVSATHDIACDGFYMLALNKEKQAFFVGVRSTFYRLGWIFGNGVLVITAGRIEKLTGNIPLSWMVAFGMASVIFLALFLYHRVILPRPASDATSQAEQKKRMPFFDAFRTFFRQPKIVAIVAFILFYRFGEAILTKMTTPFLLDDPAVGGLGLATETVGLVYGTVGTTSLIVGGILGGWLISRFGFKKCIWPMILALNLPDLAYVYMAGATPPLWLVYPLVALEQFGYGIGFTAFMVFLMYIAKEPYKTSHYAISTGLMALGMMVPGMISGFIQNAVGYFYFFIIVFLLTIPGYITLFFIPMHDTT